MVLGLAGYFSPLIAGLEVILGLFLILRVKTRSAALAVTVITTVFTIAFAYAFFFKGIEDCGCMGSFIKMPPWLSFFRNIFLIVGSYWLWKTSSEHVEGSFLWKKAAIVVVGGFCLALGGFTLAKPILNKNNIEEGENINNTFLRFYGSSLSTGRNFVFVFSPNCPHCWNATENVKSIKATPGLGQLVGITYPGMDLTTYVDAFHPNFPVLEYPTSEIFDAVKSVPLLIMIENGRIERVFRAQDIPCGPVLQKMLHP